MSASQAKPARLAAIDVARAIAMVAIICGHFGIRTANRVVYTFHVPLFLVINGYLLSTRLPVGEFIKRRAKQMLVPYYLGCVLLIIGVIVVSLVMGPEMYNLPEWLKTTLFACLYASGMRHEPGILPFAIPPVGLLWFLWGSLVAMIVVRLALETRVPALVVGISALIGWWSARYVWLPFSIQSGLLGSFYVYLGYLAKKYDLMHKKVHPVALAAALVAWGYCIWRDYSPNLVDCAIGGNGLALVGSVAGCYVILCLSRAIARYVHPLARPLSWYGQLTLIAVLFHAVQDYTFPQWIFYDWVALFSDSGYVAHLCIVGFSVLWTVVGDAVVSHIPPAMRLLQLRPPQPFDESEEGRALLGQG